MTEDEIVNDEPMQEPAQIEPVPIEQELDETCPQCQVVNMMAVLGMARTSCQLVDDPDKKEACIAWSEALDPERIDDLSNVAEGIIEHAGVQGISEYSKVLNDTMHTAVIGYVQRKLDAGQSVNDDELKLYKHLVLRRSV